MLKFQLEVSRIINGSINTPCILPFATRRTTNTTSNTTTLNYNIHFSNYYFHTLLSTHFLYPFNYPLHNLKILTIAKPPATRPTTTSTTNVAPLPTATLTTTCPLSVAQHRTTQPIFHGVRASPFLLH